MAPLLLFRYPPTIDFPQHESMVALLREHADAARFVPGMYELNLGHPNQLFHLVAWALSFPLGVPLACRVVLAAALGAIPLGMARLARSAGSTAWSALAVVPVALGWLLYWGFVTNLVGFAALLFALPWVFELEEEPTPWRSAKLCGAVLLLYFAHQLMLFVLLLAIGLGALRRLRPTRSLPLRLAPVLFGAAITWAQQRYQAHLFVAGSHPEVVRFLRVDRNLLDVALHVFGGATEGSGWLPMGVCLVALAFLVWARAVPPDGRRGFARFFAPTARAGRLLELGFVCFVAYLFLPFAVNGASFVFQRFLAPAYACFFVWGGVAIAGGRAQLARAALASVAAIALALALPSFATADAMAADLDGLIDQMEPRSSVVGIDLDHDLPRVRPFTAIHWASRALASKGGRVGLSFTTSPVAPVRTTEPYQWNLTATRLERERRLVPSVDLRRFRYLVVHSQRSALLADAAQALEPDARLVDRAGEWLLLEAREPVCPLDAPDAPLPEPPGESLVARIARVSEIVRAR
jgi:hypothetical protein